MFRKGGWTALEGTARVHAARRAPSLTLLTSPAEDPVERFRQASDDHDHVSIGLVSRAPRSLVALDMPYGLRLLRLNLAAVPCDVASF